MGSGGELGEFYRVGGRLATPWVESALGVSVEPLPLFTGLGVAAVCLGLFQGQPPLDDAIRFAQGGMVGTDDAVGCHWFGVGGLDTVAQIRRLVPTPCKRCGFPSARSPLTSPALGAQRILGRWTCNQTGGGWRSPPLHNRRQRSRRRLSGSWFVVLVVGYCSTDRITKPAGCRLCRRHQQRGCGQRLGSDRPSVQRRSVEPNGSGAKLPAPRIGQQRPDAPARLAHAF